MANLNRKERRAQRNESNIIGMLLRLFFGLSFIGLAVVLFGELDLNYVFSIFTADIIVSLIYVILNKSRITTSLAVNTNVRVIIAFLIMLVTMFFYALLYGASINLAHLCKSLYLSVAPSYTLRYSTPLRQCLLIKTNTNITKEAYLTYICMRYASLLS